MKAKLVVEGKEFEIDILDPKLQELIAPVKKTGYERVDKKSEYYSVRGWDGLYINCEFGDEDDTAYYEAANYYSDITVAENNARADKLMRQLRRFAVEHRKQNLDWNSTECQKYCIEYDYTKNKFKVVTKSRYRYPFNIYFNSSTLACAAIETFRDELIWYFTEYKDSL